MAKLFERAGASLEEIADIARRGNEGFARQCLGLYRGTHEFVEMFDPTTLIDRKGLWLSSNFQKDILSVAKKTIRVSLETSYFDLDKREADVEFRGRLGKNHVFTATEFCLWLDQKTALQPNGEEGELLKRNFCYVCGVDNEVFVVHVDWYAGDREWVVRAYSLEGGPGSSGSRAFSRNSILAK